jgi:hypothetical protein
VGERRGGHPAKGPPDAGPQQPLLRLSPVRPKP